MLEDMLRACLVDFRARWDKHFPLVEFAYNIYHFSIQMVLFDALYDRRYRSSIGLFDFVVVDNLDTDLYKDSME